MGMRGMGGFGGASEDVSVEQALGYYIVYKLAEYRICVQFLFQILPSRTYRWVLRRLYMNAVDYFSNKYSGITPKNSNLTKAKAAKNDEFYTQYSDIEAELSHYEVKYFAERVVYLPCDDWHFSQFVKYFEDNFTRLQLKALVATGINFNSAGYYYKKTSEGVITGVLDGNGDFRSEACRQLMREADIIVTNPPFSLFREFVAQIMEFRKKFLIIGNQNAINDKDIFPYIKQNRIWLGYSCVRWFEVPTTEGLTMALKKNKHGKDIAECARSKWFTNIDINKKSEPMQLTCLYDASKYPKYENYDAIEVSKTTDIPADYFGAMGVPITFLDYYCPDQFEILQVCASHGKVPRNIPNENCYLNGKWVYARILIKRKTIPVEPE